MADATPPSPGQPADEWGSYTEVIQHSQVSARVPEKVARGVFCTGLLVQQDFNQFVLDFVQRLVHPWQIVARVVLPPGVVAAILNALRDNIAMYEKQFGPLPGSRPPTPPTPAGPAPNPGTGPGAAPAPAPAGQTAGSAPAPAPQPPAGPRPSIEDIYGHFKLSDDMLSGVFANGTLITHTQAEFCLDFITNFYPRSAVSCRVYLAAGQMAVIRSALTQAFQQYQQKIAALQQGHHPPGELRPPG